jgi:hypothetical protein
MTTRLSAKSLASRLILGGGVGFIAASPIIVGIVSIRSDFFPFAALTSVILAVLVLLLPITGRYRVPLQRIILVLVAVSFAATSMDLISRVLFAGWVYNSPEDRYLTQWPKMPLVHRFMPNRKYLGYPEYRVYREIRFQSDAYGFRNDESDPTDIDLIVLGDSFGTGSGTTQEDTWATALANRYGFTVYNLSVAGSPWEEYTNLTVELDRLDMSEDAVVLWMITSATDLEGDYHPIYEPSALPWNTWFESLVVSYQSFRFHSPIRLNLRRIYLASGTQDPVILEHLPDGTPFMFYQPFASRRDRTAEEIQQIGTFSALKETVSAMRQLAESNDFQVMIILAPSKSEVYSWMLDDGEPWSTPPDQSGFSIALQEVAEQEGLCFLDLKPILVEASREVYEEKGEVFWWPDDTHWNPRGNELAASVIVDNPCLSSIQ